MLAATSLKGAVKTSVESLLEPMYAQKVALENTSKSLFCWSTVAAFCKKIDITDDLKWARDYYGIVENLGWIYTTCCEGRGLKDGTPRLLLGGIPDDLANRPPSVVTFYKWIQRAHQVLHRWMERFDTQSLTSAEVNDYKTHYSFIKRMAVAVSSSELLIDSKKLKEYSENCGAMSKRLSECMFCYIPEHPDIRWYDLCKC